MTSHRCNTVRGAALECGRQIVWYLEVESPERLLSRYNRQQYERGSKKQSGRIASYNALPNTQGIARRASPERDPERTASRGGH